MSPPRDNLPLELWPVADCIALHLIDLPPDEAEAELIEIVRSIALKIKATNPSRSVAECRALACLTATEIESRMAELRFGNGGCVGTA